MPYQPFFVGRLEAGNVAQIDSIEGELRKEASYDPPGDAEPVEVMRFQTQVPGVIADRLTRLLSEQDVRRQCCSSASSSGSCAAR